MTTLTLIFIVLYRIAKDIKKDELLESEINETYLINKFAPEEEKLKLRPTENNNQALKYLLRGDENEEFTESSRLIENFNYLKSQISKENFEIVREGISKLIFVEVSLERQKDSPQRIFESLNSTGRNLSEADLIRNYILMGLNKRDQEKIYHNYWEVIEKFAKNEKANESKVSDYVRDYLTLENKKIPTKDKVYNEFKIKYPTSTVEKWEESLVNIKKLVKHYNKLINPKNEADSEIKTELSYINRLEINVAFPFLMKVYDDYDLEIIDKSTFLEVLRLIQSFVWRRFIVGLPTSILKNTIFMTLYDKIDPGDYLLSIQKTLIMKSGQQRFPKDKEVVDFLKSKDVYTIKSKNRSYLFEKLENHNNNEPVVIDGNDKKITIEHIFPQTPDESWSNDLDSGEFESLKEDYLHTIANLTLSGNNGSLGNKSFPEKKSMNKDGGEQGYIYSRLWLNQYLRKIEKWDSETLKERYGILSKRFLEIWSYPEIDANTNIFDADDPTDKKLEYAIFLDQRTELREVTKLYEHVFKKLFESNPRTFFSSYLRKSVKLTGNPRELGHPLPVNDTYFIESQLSNVDKFERIKLALTIFDLEDKLFIKYADN
ncbi:MAG: DUF262 domain-containing protein [Ekhidna sp.]|nr:DUF262 domain-containing protein [Ekhidna sp.]